MGNIAGSMGLKEMLFKNWMIADCGRGITLKYGSEGPDHPAYVQNSFITAISRPSCT